MPKNSVKQIEKDEKKILDELTKNANLSVNEIANKLGFSRQKVWRIIKNLEKDKTIWGYTAIIDDNKMGRKRFYILLKKAPVKVTDEKLNLVINRDLRKIAIKNGVNIESTYFFHGSYDGQICVIAEDIINVKNFIADMEKKIGAAYFKETNILEVLVPIQMRGFNNPNLKQLKDYFALD
ncbi:MAG: Lrp/AsnC family transcriptional regulator [Candidatus Thermoplasmatota archaeon]|nr:Lrp/AsnC family transcriptional regulator [Candidatus Thermoplasmatota archaeon]